MTLHVRYTFWYISFPSSAKQQREMTRFKLLFLENGNTRRGIFLLLLDLSAIPTNSVPGQFESIPNEKEQHSSKPEMAAVSACADVLPRCHVAYNYHDSLQPCFMGELAI